MKRTKKRQRATEPTTSSKPAPHEIILIDATESKYILTSLSPYDPHRWIGYLRADRTPHGMKVIDSEIASTGSDSNKFADFQRQLAQDARIFRHNEQSTLISFDLCRSPYWRVNRERTPFSYDTIVNDHYLICGANTSDDTKIAQNHDEHGIKYHMRFSRPSESIDLNAATITAYAYDPDAFGSARRIEHRIITP